MIVAGSESFDPKLSSATPDGLKVIASLKLIPNYRQLLLIVVKKLTSLKL